MKAVADLPARVLEGRLAPTLAPDDAAAASRVAYAAQLADRGDHAAAAHEAAALIEAGIHDIRLIAFYLFGVFVQRGVTQLPALLARVTALIRDELAALRPERRKLQIVNSAAAWLFEHVSAQLAFHARQRDPTWATWCGESAPETPEAIAAACSQLTTALESVIDAPLAAVPLARIRRWALEDLRRAAARREPAQPTPAPTLTSPAAPADDTRDAPPDDASDDDGSPGTDACTAPTELAPGGGDPALRRAAAPPRPYELDRPAAPDGPPIAIGSPALAALQAKLAGFQVLVARGELAKAAVIASDVRTTLARFDPIAYFPAMFAAYFKTLHQVIDELAAYLDASDQPAWDALESYYRADLRGFLDE
jgi:hypothetical protein